MKAVRLHGARDIRLDEVPPPGAPANDDLLVAPLWCGLCGTDLKAYVEPEITLAAAPLPLILGHEFSARVVAVGPAMTSVQVGDEVVVMPLEHCGRCPICSRGEFSHCPNKKWIGLSSEWGGLGDVVLIHAYQVSPLQGVSAVDGALIEPAAVAMNAVLRAEVVPGSEVLVVGCGPIGAFAVMAAFAAGAARVFVREPNAARAAIASDLGAHVSSDFAETEVDVAIDCAGQEGTTAACISAVRPGGRVCVPAVHKSGTEIDIRAVTRRELSLVGSMGYTREVWHRTLQLVRWGRLPVGRAVTSRIGRDDIVKKGFEVLASPEQGELKVVVSVTCEEATV